MAFKVEITEAAEAQILVAYLWFKENASSYADCWFNGLMEALNSLREKPMRCPLAPENNEFQEEVRQLLYGKRNNAYRILFEVRGDTVYILYVRHHAQARLTAEDIYSEDEGA